MGLSPNLPPTALDALRAATISADGLTLTLTGQLDADTYRRVKKALDTYGGKWNRKAGTHEFTKDFRPHLAHLIAGGKVGADNGGKNPLAFFPTPEPVIQEMCSRIWPWPNGSRFLEPSAGEGAIADFLWNRHSVYADCVELDEDRAQTIRAKGFKVVGSDFLQFTPEQPYDYVLMNPPFTVDGDPQVYIDHIEHALTCLRPGGDLLAVVPGSFAWLSRKRVAEFRAFCETHAQSPLHQFDPGTFKASGTDIATCLIHITKPEDAPMTPTTESTARKPRSKKADVSTDPGNLDFKALAAETRKKMQESYEKGKTGREKKLDLNGAQRSGGKLGSREPQPQEDLPFPVTEAEIEQALMAPEAQDVQEPEVGEATADLQTAPAQLPGTPALFAAPLLSDSMLGFYTLGQLDAWAEQPRREFDPEKLAELAESIAHKGLMQNLVGRLRGDGIVEIIAGGRRYRALKMLEEAGRLPTDFMVPVRLQALSDLEALQLATAENVERSSMTPLEEADAFARMVHLGAMPEDIALKFGYSLKTVQQRLVLAEGLGVEGRELFAAGDINLGQAQVIAQTSGPLRKHVLQSAKQGQGMHALQNLIKNSSFLVEHAKFDVAASGLEVIQDLYGDQPARFADPKAALALQLDWVQARAKELEGKKEQHFVDVLKKDADYLSLPYDTYTTYNAPKSVLGTMIMVSTVTGEVKESRCAREADLKSARAKEQAAERQKASSEATGSEGAAIRKQGWIDGHEARATALRSALVGDHKRAVALTILMMLEAEPVSLRASLNHVQAVPIPAGLQRLREIVKVSGGLSVTGVSNPQQPLGTRLAYGVGAEQHALEYLDLLLSLSLEDLLDIQSVLIAQATGGWSTYNPVHPPKPFLVRLAADTGATVEFRLTDDHLKAYPRDRLLELAQDAGLDAIVANASKYPTSGSLRAAILEHAEALHTRGYVPPIARFPEVPAAAPAQAADD